MKRTFLRNQSGAAAVEFGLVAPILTVLLIGVATYGGTILAYNKMRMAVSSGAQYAMTVGDSTNAISTVVTAAWPNKPGSGVVNVTQQCLCGATVTDCTTNCADGDYPQKFTTINASMTYAGFAGSSKAISVNEKVRTR